MKNAISTQSHFLLRHVRQAFDRHAREYDTHAQLQQGVLFNALRQLEPALRADMTILDAGCGTGYLMDLLRHNDVPFTVMACDAAYGMCEQAARRHEEDHPHHVACADISALPYGDGTCDMAISSLVLQWVKQTETALAEIHRVLKPGGKAVVTTFGPMTLQELRESFAEVDNYPHVSSFISADAVAEQARSVGFSVQNASTEFRTQHYESVRDLMLAIRIIGAANKAKDRRKSLTGRQRFSGMEAIYRDRYETARGIPASWEIIYLLLHKED